MKRSICPALGILVGLVAVVGLITCGDKTQTEQARQEAAQQEQARKEAARQEQARQELQEAIASLLKGQGVPQAAAYDKDSPRPHRLVIVTGSGTPHKWASLLPSEWIAETVGELALIVVIEDKEEQLGSRQYIGGPSITRYRHEMRIDVRVALTGILLDGFTMKGETPNFPYFASQSTTRIDGRVDSADFAEALCGHLKLVSPNTGEPTGRRETDPIGMEFVELGSGSVLIGSNQYENERPVHRATISRAFHLQTTEVTQGQWRAVMGDNPSHFKNGDNHPVESVSWKDVQVFLKKLNALDPGKNYRLPTEAEWEYACRAATIGTRHGKLGVIAWYSDNSDSQTHPVGKKQPNAWGLYDMLGNVDEWCADWYGENYYENSPIADPRGPSSGEYRVQRGGSWYDAAYLVRSASRGRSSPPDNRDDRTGFRCARD